MRPALAAVVATIVAAAGSQTGHGGRAPLPAGFVQFQTGPDGGSVWQGRIANPYSPRATRTTVVYLPPNYSPARRYPVVYLLQGAPGSPYQYVFGLQLASRAETLIRERKLPPFLAVIPPAGVTVGGFREWTGPWENYLVHTIVPWSDRQLSADARGRGRVVAGLSAGAYGAVDIGLRHPGLFGALEAWSGYFDAPHDGSLAHAGAAELAAHDPSLLVRREAALLLRLHVRFFLSAGTADRPTLHATRDFARELTDLRLPHRLWLGAGGHNGSLWRTQFAAAFAYALG